jgi:hypothetical protein
MGTAPGDLEVEGDGGDFWIFACRGVFLWLYWTQDVLFMGMSTDF